MRAMTSFEWKRKSYYRVDDGDSCASRQTLICELVTVIRNFQKSRWRLFVDRSGNINSWTGDGYSWTGPETICGLVTVIHNFQKSGDGYSWTDPETFNHDQVTVIRGQVLKHSTMIRWRLFVDTSWKPSKWYMTVPRVSEESASHHELQKKSNINLYFSDKSVVLAKNCHY